MILLLKYRKNFFTSELLREGIQQTLTYAGTLFHGEIFIIVASSAKCHVLHWIK